MKVYIKNKYWSWGGGSSVVNENKEPVYQVKGKVFSINGKMIVKIITNIKIFFFILLYFIYPNLVFV